MIAYNRSLLVLTVTLLLFIGYQFIDAAWTPATGTPPDNNTAAPLNVSATTQAKSGNLQANIFAATTEMRSNQYCDALGGNCVSVTALGSPTIQLFEDVAPDANLGAWDFCALTQNRFNDDKDGSATWSEGCELNKVSGSWVMLHNGFAGNGCSAACFSL